MLKSVRREDAEVYDLPGRDFLLLVGPENTGAEGLTLGLAVFPEGSAPPGHVHESAEEVIYVVSGNGKLDTAKGSIELAPGTAVYIPPGLLHATVSQGPGPLELVSVFSPPVVPGSYETGAN